MGKSGKWEEKYISWKAYLWKDMYSEEPYKMLVEGEEYISFGRNIIPQNVRKTVFVLGRHCYDLQL